MRRLGEIEVPRGAVALVCALVCLPPAGMALGHDLFSRDGGWVHHHTRYYDTCNYINQAFFLTMASQSALTDWDDNTAIEFDPQAKCHVSEGAPEASHVQLQDAHFGPTGWTASSLDNETASDNARYHGRHTHISFNLTYLDGSHWTLNPYDLQALVCRELGRVAGINRVPAGQWAAEGTNNDCMSFSGQPSSVSGQVSRAQNPSNFEYSASVGQHTKDLVSNRYRGHEPSIELDLGSMQDSIDSVRPLYGTTYPIHAAATDGAHTDPDGGLARLEMRVDGEQVDVATTECVDPGSCQLETDMELVTAAYEDGPHTLEVIATDKLGLTVRRTVPFEIDIRGNVYHAKKVTSNPASGGKVLREEWARVGTKMARIEVTEDLSSPAAESLHSYPPIGRDEETTVTTRSPTPCVDDATQQCDEVRSMTIGALSTWYGEYDGSSRIDPNLAEISELLDWDQFSPTTEVIGQGSLSTILAPWQTPPPASGPNYLVLRRIHPVSAVTGTTADGDDITEDDNAIERAWIEATTGLPIKTTSTRQSTGQLLGTRFWTYEPRRHQVDELPANFFRVTRPTNPPILPLREEHVTYHGARDVGMERDVETNQLFEPHSWEPAPVLPLGADGTATRLCLIGNDTVFFGDPPEQYAAESGEDAIDPSGPETYVASNYVTLESGQICEPGSRAGDPDLDVISLASAGSTAAAARQDYVPEAQALTASSNDNAPEIERRAAVRSLSVDGQQAVAYMVPLADDESSTLVDVGPTTLLVTGDVVDDNLAPVVAALEGV